MIYKVIADFEEGLEDAIKELSKKFMVLLYRNTIYVASKEGTVEKTEVEKIIESTIKESFYCQEINEKNLKYEPTKVVEWCKDQFIRLDTIKFEQERQAELNAMYDFVKAIDRELATLVKASNKV